MLKNKLYSLCSILWSMLWISLCILSLGTEPGLEHAHRHKLVKQAIRKGKGRRKGWMGESQMGFVFLFITYY